MKDIRDYYLHNPSEKIKYKIKEKQFFLYKILLKKNINKKILYNMMKIPRHLFIPIENNFKTPFKNNKPDEEKIIKHITRSYENKPQSIGNYITMFGGKEHQTISQPYIVAFMLQLLDLKKGQKVLEIGAGSGYNASIISKIIKNANNKIVSMDIVKELIQRCELTVRKLNKYNIVDLNDISFIYEDGYNGYPKHSPYDRIIVTASIITKENMLDSGELSYCPYIPKKLINQLDINGIIVSPIQFIEGNEYLYAIKKKGKKNYVIKKSIPVRFVDMIKKKNKYYLKNK